MADFFLFPKIKDKELLDFFENLKNNEACFSNTSDIYGKGDICNPNLKSSDEIKVSDEEIEQFIKENNL
ncbi:MULTISPECIES: hypothetical protein [Campylobacter]|uniref:hypothetical protein n=1 Tax=Campylobacter TaxID=194 RepID=UPI0005CED396|nr:MULTISPECIES: hypothetical protein [Campylobacter]EAK3634453.1 hypothetical protein [Campylobacter jejuni]ECO2874566.1 hypothetical protein [Campylobacter jejuni]ECR2944285.1 hypothetical protein [Campylobacter jejuni]EDP1905878.1 hypothetical protein [Campylobacter jejuni]EDP4408250.1 hypothetical protein [Campylobacter jejuni]